MKRLELSVSLTGGELKELVRRCHFDMAALPQIGALHGALFPLLHTEGIYDISAGALDGYVGGISPSEKERCLCVVTLGNDFDRLQELYGEAGAVWEEYILECLGNSLLEKAYGQLGRRIWQDTGLFLNAYYFPGSDMPIGAVKDILRELSAGEEDFPVSCNEAYTLRPGKSVVFIGGLGEKKDGCGICDNCRNEDCEYRRVGAAAGRNRENYSYGYQRIFGGKGAEDGNDSTVLRRGKREDDGGSRSGSQSGWPGAQRNIRPVYEKPGDGGAEGTGDAG